MPYCSGSERSSPHSWRNAATTAGSAAACSPRLAVTGLAGTAWDSRNARSVMPTSIGPRRRSRRATKSRRLVSSGPCWSLLGHRPEVHAPHAAEGHALHVGAEGVGHRGLEERRVRPGLGEPLVELPVEAGALRRVPLRLGVG